MLTIYKYEFNPDDSFTLKIPATATVLRIECQRDQPCVWAMVDTDAPPRTETFRVVGTGHPIDPEVVRECAHLGTFQQGPFVWHVFGPKRLASPGVGS